MSKIVILATAAVIAFASPASAGLIDNGTHLNALGDNAVTANAIGGNSLGGNAIGQNAIGLNGTHINGVHAKRLSLGGLDGMKVIDIELPR